MINVPYQSEVIRPPSGAAIPALIALGTNVLMLNVLAVTGFWTIYLLDDGTQRAQDMRDILALGTLAEAVLTVVAGIPVIVWLWRARTNADVIDRPDGWGRPWVIFGWVVPIVSLWVPRSIVGSVWRVSAPQGRSFWPVNVWWTAYLLYLSGGRLVTLDSDGFRAALYPVVVEVGALAALAAMMVVWQITRFQEAQAVRLSQALSAGL